MIKTTFNFLSRNNPIVMIAIIFVTMSNATYAQVPTITSITPNTATPSSSVVISGTNFNDTISNDIVYFGATQGTVTAATTTSLTVTVPLGATHSLVSVLNTTYHLRGYEQYAFVPTYDNSCFTPGGFNFNSNIDLPVGLTPYVAAIGDLDGDGKPDLVVVNHGSAYATVYRNISTSGSLTASSFSASATFTVDASGTNIKLADMDGDGKLDMLMSSSTTARVDVLRNTSTSGSISFAAKVNVSVGAKPSQVIVADFDGDGRPDIATADLAIDSVAVVRNLSVSGVLVTASFAAPVKFRTGHGPASLVASDVDGDGKQDIIVGNDSAASISILRNAVTAPGSFTPSSFDAKVDFTAGSLPAEIQSTDIDGDGKPEIMVVNAGSNTLSVFHNTATAGGITSSSFSPKVDFTTGLTPESLVAADMDGDGKVDLVVSNNGGMTISIFRNTATSGAITATSLATSYDITTYILPFGMVIGDIDGDKRPDIILANAAFNSLSIFRNNPLPNVAPVSGTTTVCTGSTTTLSTTTTGGTWSIANSTLATINPSTGVITGIAAGADTAIYSVICGGDTNNVMTPITISSGAPVNVTTGIPVFCSTATTALINTTAGGTWSSSNPSIATVSTTGVVSGVAQGSAIISYTVTGSCGVSSDTIQVTVNIPAANITGASQVCQAATITLGDVTTGGVWSSDNTAVATISATGVVTGIAAGSANMYYAVNNTCGNTSAALPLTVHSTHYCDSVLSVLSVPSADASIQIFPNPNNGAFTVLLSTTDNENALITVTNIVGQKVAEIPYVTNKHTEIVLNEHAGVYFIQITTANNKYTNKLTIRQ